MKYKSMVQIGKWFFGFTIKRFSFFAAWKSEATFKNYGERVGWLPIVRDDGLGYTYKNQDIDGFSDNADLPVVVRERIARFAATLAPEQLSATQKELLDRASGPSDRLRELAANEAKLDEAPKQ